MCEVEVEIVDRGLRGVRKRFEGKGEWEPETFAAEQRLEGRGIPISAYFEARVDGDLAIFPFLMSDGLRDLFLAGEMDDVLRGIARRKFLAGELGPRDWKEDDDVC